MSSNLSRCLQPQNFPKNRFLLYTKTNSPHFSNQNSFAFALPLPCHFSIDVSLISRLPQKITSITQLNCLLCPCCTHVPENLILCHQKSQALHLYTRLSFVKHKQLINHDCCQRLKNITSKDKTPLINLKPSRIVYWDSRIRYQGSRHSKNFTRIVIHRFEETI